MFERKTDPHFDTSETSRLTVAEQFILTDLAARLAFARALSNAGGNPVAFAKRVGDDVQEFLALHRVVGIDVERKAEAEEFILQKAQEFIAACAQHPAAFEPAAIAPRRTRR